ncbi:hypothetical protein [Pseudotamlana agarivorans]|uniref:hypothetical protein n=1 Tax=Pseudotamlana agarivorans TaxID=481183 RepID=UPI00082D3F2C|nr:hypothetical protein [Tamlana agarivorans]
MDYSFDSAVSYEGENLNALEIESGNNFAFGLGYKYNDKISLEVRQQTGRELINTHRLASTKYKSLSIVLGYSLF